MTALADVLELLHHRRRVPVVTEATYGLWVRSAPDDGARRLDGVARFQLARLPPNLIPRCDLLAWSGGSVPSGNQTILLDPLHCLASSIVRVGQPATVAGRLGWELSFVPTPPLFVPRETLLFLFPSPDEPAEWELVIDQELGTVLALRCMVAGEVIGTMEMLSIGPIVTPEPEEPSAGRMVAEEPAGPPAPDDAAPAPEPVVRLVLPAGWDEANIVVDGLLIETMKATSGACRIVIACADAAAARNAVDAARAAVWHIPHPEEPDDPLPSFVSDAEPSTGGSSFWFDMADAQSDDGLVAEVLSAILAAAVASGLRDAHISARG